MLNLEKEERYRIQALRAALERRPWSEVEEVYAHTRDEEAVRHNEGQQLASLAVHQERPAPRTGIPSDRQS